MAPAACSMTERGHRLTCPVCLGVVMEEVTVKGQSERLEIDVCRRCGGVWLDHGEVQRLRTAGRVTSAPHLERRDTPHVAQCHYCHAPLGRHVEHCPACGGPNRLDCPVCEREMEGVLHGGLRLDLCRSCKGTWFDHDEVKALWTPRFDRALARRDITRSDIAITGAEATSDVLFYAMFWSPELFDAGASVVGGVASGAGELITNAPEVIGAMPEVAGGIVEVVAESSGDVFEAIVEIVAGIFG